METFEASQLQFATLSPISVTSMEDSTPDSAKTVPPTFLSEWETEFASNTFEPSSITVTSAIGVLLLFMLMEGQKNMFQCLLTNCAMTFPPQLVSMILLFSIFAFSCHKGLRGLCKSNYNILCVAVIMTIFFNVLWLSVSAPVDSVNSNFDSEIRKIHPMHMQMDLELGQSTLLSPVSSSFCALASLLPSILGMSPIAAIFVSVADLLILIGFSFLFETEWLGLSIAILLQACAGFSAARMCASHVRIAREQFAVAKASRFASEQTCNRLHTLIPKQVLPRLASHAGGAMLGTLIPQCTVMFCSLDFGPGGGPALSAELYRLLDDIFSAFDDAVERSGMFKYQHVGDWCDSDTARRTQTGARPPPVCDAHTADSERGDSTRKGAGPVSALRRSAAARRGALVSPMCLTQITPQ